MIVVKIEPPEQEMPSKGRESDASFRAPLDDLLPRLRPEEREPEQLKAKRAGQPSERASKRNCPAHLNQALFERAHR